LKQKKNLYAETIETLREIANEQATPEVTKEACELWHAAYLLERLGNSRWERLKHWIRTRGEEILNSDAAPYVISFLCGMVFGWLTVTLTGFAQAEFLQRPR